MNQPVKSPPGQPAKPPEALKAPEITFDYNDVGPARLRPRHAFLILTFIIIVVVPVGLSAWLSWSFAGTLRQVTFSVTVQEQSLGVLGESPTGSDALRTAVTGSGAEETAIVRQLVNSEDFYRTIRDEIDLTAIWPHDRVVPFLPPRYDADAPVEEGHSYWLNMVSVNLGSRDNIIRITVTAFDQQSAERLLRAIQAEAERRLNLARTATLTAARAEAEKRVEELRVTDEKNRQALLEFRLRSESIDPSLLGELNAEFRNVLRSMQAEEEIAIAEASASVSQDETLTRRSEDRIAALQYYLENPESSQGRVVTPKEASELIAEYHPLITEAEISGLSLRVAELSILHYNRELESNKVFLTSVTGGNSSTIQVFPQFGPTLIVVFIGTFTVWCLVLLTFYAIRDRK
ncbi:hypothetical protein [Paracoccus albus]|uniref:hypothetical protein n=1 Tax=Paracoccus albus TaxID=3017784 RepID=UPI0022F133A6|nr:hypothetical protein [Paracoccus albus]WBU59758.1 hypothetical protein PAF20_13510 [Paracoccus albus]